MTFHDGRTDDGDSSFCSVLSGSFFTGVLVGSSILLRDPPLEPG
jgi:hypothetical protein